MTYTPRFPADVPAGRPATDPPGAQPTHAPAAPEESHGSALSRRADVPRAADRPWRVAAWVAPGDLLRLGSALGPEAVVLPCGSLDAFAAAVTAGAAAGIVRAGCVTAEDVTALTNLVSGHPATLFAGLHSATVGEAPPDQDAGYDSVFRLWAAGVLAVVYPIEGVDQTAWPILRRSLAAARLADPVQRACVGAVLEGVWGEYRTDLDDRQRGAPGEPALLAFFAAAFGPGVDPHTDLAALTGRFLHRGLPGADRYVGAARLVRAAWVGGPPDPRSVVIAGRPTHPEAPAGVRLAVRRLERLAALGSGRPPGQAAGTRALRQYCRALVAPFGDALAAFNPTGERAR